MKRSVPMRVDRDFYDWCHSMIQANPKLNQRKITKNLAKMKFIIGDAFLRDEMEIMQGRKRKR